MQPVFPERLFGAEVKGMGGELHLAMLSTPTILHGWAWLPSVESAAAPMESRLRSICVAIQGKRLILELSIWYSCVLALWNALVMTVAVVFHVAIDHDCRAHGSELCKSPLSENSGK